MLAVLRDFAPDPEAFDAFTPSGSSMWWCGEYRLSGVTKERADRGWVVRGTVENAGTARMTVEVAGHRETSAGPTPGMPEPER